ncbi:hypothetical protein [Maioricimonas sp. JC845]|uniref:hypothetical protein n=1 Tax=Maioricimonas sp. JC845 TaxID=3232138 RepID=UPI00345AE813
MSDDHSNRRVTPAGRSRLVAGLLIFGCVVAVQLIRFQFGGDPNVPVPQEPIPVPAVAPTQTDTTEPSDSPAPTSPQDAVSSEPQERQPATAVLTELPGGTLQSPAGLLYERGSAEGHRLDHVLRHSEDMPSRPIHGVFDGGRDEIVAVIDEAWQKAQTRGPPTAVTEQQGDRTVYTVDLERRIGYIGGRAGQRQNHPPARHLKLVLEDRSVITAYPLVP